MPYPWQSKGSRKAGLQEWSEIPPFNIIILNGGILLTLDYNITI